MPIETGPLLKLVWGGSLHTAEQWACSLHLVGVQDGDFPGGQDISSLAPVLQDWFDRPASAIQGGARLEFVKLNQIARGPVGQGLPGGKQDPAKVTNEHLFVPAMLGGFGIVPGQLTVAVTMHTDIQRGRASKGRFYPPTVSSVGPDGRLLSINSTSAADSAQELLSEINALTDIAGPLRVGTIPKCVVCVWSSAGQIARGVERVSVGRVVDTQRRRRSSLDEDRQFAAANV